MLFACGKIWAQPDLAVFNGIEEIMNGDNTPSLVDNTDFGVFNLGEADDMEVFSIFSWGDVDIDVSSVSVTPGAYFSVILDPGPDPGFFLPWTFTVTFEASTAPVGIYDADRKSVV